MAENKLLKLSLEELQAKKKKFQYPIIGLGIVLFVACATLIYLAIVGQNYTLIVVAIGCLLSILPSIIVLRQISTEIKARQ